MRFEQGGYSHFTAILCRIPDPVDSFVGDDFYERKRLLRWRGDDHPNVFNFHGSSEYTTRRMERRIASLSPLFIKITCSKLIPADFVFWRELLKAFLHDVRTTTGKFASPRRLDLPLSGSG